MNLYVCYGTFPTPRPGGHPCANAKEALVKAGHSPTIKKAYGLGLLPDTPFNLTPGRKKVKALTGSSMVPVLELDDGTTVAGSKEIVAWAEANPK
jgi:hypothetical protein